MAPCRRESRWGSCGPSDGSSMSSRLGRCRPWRSAPEKSCLRHGRRPPSTLIAKFASHSHILHLKSHFSHLTSHNSFLSSHTSRQSSSPSFPSKAPWCSPRHGTDPALSCYQHTTEQLAQPRAQWSRPTSSLRPDSLKSHGQISCLVPPTTSYEILHYRPESFCNGNRNKWN